MIVVGFIATAEGRAALEAAVEEAGRRSDSVTVLVHGPRGAEQEDVDTAAAEARQLLSGRDISSDVQTVPLGGDVAEALMEAAESLDAALIVIGLRRRSPLGKLILGSNAQRILLDAPCPVLAVKPELN
ncbi:universal stress protein [Ruania alba]|uniref:Nucleotide-binding universal stress protein, UspA family n=1 Tax=Ruania alba TaxID=648782 RepID=A0A1H5FJ25_9MICO|nr:universal stress protein [Ruania alba]SEE03018.1 Nucleotide-binding universal stress protein, UspA family [Ruania alba]